jgi:tetrapyrrole methylase family protein/MazG family protein
LASRRTKTHKSRSKPRPRKPASASISRRIRKSTRTGTGKLFEKLVALQIRLLAPNGCPWDREQTHESLRTYLIEEAYEVLDALESGDSSKFAEELGDLLLQIIFHSVLAAQAGRFEIDDVIDRVHTKMVRRHPHVFGKVKAGTSAQVLKNWEQLKAEERRMAKNNGGLDPSGASDNAPAPLLSGIPSTLPAVLEAYQLTRRAARVGFDWSDIGGVLEKLQEEIAELRAEIALGKSPRMEAEVGDLLFAAVNVARFLKLDPEIALKSANRKFVQRFRNMELQAAKSNRKLADLSPAELDVLWNRAKNAELSAKAAR